MKKIRLSKLTFILAGLLIAVLLGSGMFFIPILLPEKVADKQPEILGQTISASPSIAPSIAPSPSTKALAKASLKPSIKPSAKPSVKPSPSANPTVSATPNPSASASPTVLGTTASSPSSSASPTSNPSPPAGGSPSPSPTPSVQTVSVEVQGSSFTVEISGDLNVCQVMQKAKEQGKISSLTLDDSYLSSMNSLYVREMNGMSNNWTFKVNGNSPLGCSLYQVKPNDQIVWKFG